jgi:4'-phosphopantetheinyl transferase EntD
MSKISPTNPTIDAAALKQYFSHVLGLPLVLSIAVDPLPINELSDGEQQVFSTSRHPKWQASTLLGRNALKQTLRKLRLPSDTSKLSFPHKQLSLSHCGDVAIAVGSKSTQGLGIDILNNRIPRAGSERFYLTEDEKQWLAQQSKNQADSDNATHRQRLWTMKEALFKANLNNANHRLYTSYQINTPLENTGTATDAANQSYRYATWQDGSLVITVAVANQ